MYHRDMAKKVINCLVSGDSVLLVGAAGIGKSQFIREISRKENYSQFLVDKKEKIIFIQVNVDDLPQISPAEFFRLSLKRTFDQLESIKLSTTAEKNGKESIKSENNASLLLEKLRTLLALLCEKNFHVVFSIDGLERLVETTPDAFFNNLKSLRDYCSVDNFTFLVASKRQPGPSEIEKLSSLYKLISPFTFYLKPLCNEESLKLVRQISKLRGLRITKESEAKITKMAGSYPSLIKGVLLHLTNNPEDDLVSLSKNVDRLPAIRVRLDEIYNHLEYEEQVTLKDLDAEQTVKKENPSYPTLLYKGIIDEAGKIAIPLLKAYVEKFNKTGEVRGEINKGKTETGTNLYINPVTKRVYKNGKELQNLTKQEFRLLSFLFGNYDKICDRDEVVQAVWDVDEDSGVSDEAVDQLVTRLRSKIEDNKSNPRHLLTIRGRGFSFKP